MMLRATNILLLLVSAFLVSDVGLPPAQAQTSGPWPPSLGGYFWRGNDGSGNGNTGDFSWDGPWIGGRWYAEGDEGCTERCKPPTYYQLAPEDGDALYFKYGFFDPEIATPPFNISLDSHTLPSSDVGFEIYANFSGGSFDVRTVGIITTGDEDFPGVFPVQFDGTSFHANQSFSAGAANDTLTFSAATIESPQIQLNSFNSIFPGAPAPPDGTALLWVKMGSTVQGDVVTVNGGGVAGDSRVNFSDSSLSALGLEIGFAEGEGTAQLNLMDASTATPSQYVIVGKTGHGALSLSGASSLISPAAYGVVGEDGEGFLRVADHSEMRLNSIEVGLRSDGSVAVDSSGKLFTNNAFLGRIIGFDGTVDIENEGRWETGSVTIGENGSSHVYVRNKGTFKINDSVILGKNENSNGFIHLIGSDAKLELAAGGTLTIGEHGSGTLDLSDGAKFTSQGTVNLGHVAGGSSTVTVDGEGSEWTVDGRLNIGEHGTGRVEITKQGKMTANGASIYVGFGTGSDGTLSLDDEGSSIDFDGELYLGFDGKGTVSVKNAAEFEAEDLTMGHRAGSTGHLEFLNGTDELLERTLAGDTTIGKGGRGILDVNDNTLLNSTGEVVLGEEASSGSEQEPNQAMVGRTSRWTVSGDMTIAKMGKAFVEVGAGSTMEVQGELLSIGAEEGSAGLLTFRGEIGSSSGTSLGRINGSLKIGEKGRGKLALETNAQAFVFGDVRLGELLHGRGELELGEDSLLLSNGEIYVGGEGTGSIKFGGESAEVVSNVRIIIDGEQPMFAVVTVDEDHSIISAPEIVVGENGQGTLNLRHQAAIKPDGTYVSARPKLVVASNANSIGHVSLIESEAKLQNLEAGYSGTATLQVEDSFLESLGLDVEEKIQLGQAGGGTAQLTLDDNGRVTTKELIVYAGSSVQATNESNIILKQSGLISLRGNPGNPATLTIADRSQLITSGPTDGTLLSLGSEPGTAGVVELKSASRLDLDRVAIGNTGGSSSSATQMTVSDSDTLLETGSLAVYGNTSLTLQSGAVAIVKNSQYSTIFSSSAAVDVRGQLNVQSGSQLAVSEGGMSINAGTASFSGGAVGNVKTVVDMTGGTIKVGGGTLRIGTLNGSIPDEVGVVQLLPGGTLKGTGSIDGSLKTYGGTNLFKGVKIGHSPGTLTITGDLVADAGTVFEMEVAGTGTDQQDVLHVAGNAQIDGNVLLKFIDGYAPSSGDQFTLFTAADLDFSASVFVRNLAPGWEYAVSGGAGAWIVTSLSDAVYVTPGDYNIDGSIDAADYTVWRDAFGQSGFDQPADGNDDGIVDELDLAVWKSNFGATSGSGASKNFAVPEPNSIALVLLTMVAPAYLRRR